MNGSQNALPVFSAYGKQRGAYKPQVFDYKDLSVMLFGRM
jgi:hypothetical protein